MTSTNQTKFKSCSLEKLDKSPNTELRQSALEELSQELKDRKYVVKQVGTSGALLLKPKGTDSEGSEGDNAENICDIAEDPVIYQNLMNHLLPNNNNHKNMDSKNKPNSFQNLNPIINSNSSPGPLTFYNLKYLGERSITNPKSEVAALNCLTDVCNSYVLHPDDCTPDSGLMSNVNENLANQFYHHRRETSFGSQRSQATQGSAMAEPVSGADCNTQRDDETRADDMCKSTSTLQADKNSEGDDIILMPCDQKNKSSQNHQKIEQKSANSNLTSPEENNDTNNINDPNETPEETIHNGQTTTTKNLNQDQDQTSYHSKGSFEENFELQQTILANNNSEIQFRHDNLKKQPTLRMELPRIALGGTIKFYCDNSNLNNTSGSGFHANSGSGGSTSGMSGSGSGSKITSDNSGTNFVKRQSNVEKDLQRSTSLNW